MAEDSVARITRRALLVGSIATGVVVAAEATGIFKQKQEIREIASEVVVTKKDVLRTSTRIPDPGEMPNTVDWNDVLEAGGEKYEGQNSLPLRLVPLVYGQNPDGPGQGRWAELDIKSKTGEQKKVFFPVDAILYKTAPSISKVQKIDNGIVYTDVGQKIPQDNFGKIDMTRTLVR